MSELDRDLLPTADARRGRRARGWTVPLIIGSALLMQTLNANVLTNALPTMARDLGEDPLRLNMAITIYLLASAVFLPVSAWAADKFGARRVFVLAMVVYAVSSAGSGLAADLTQLLFARLLQGAASAMMLPVGRLLLLRTTPKSELLGAMSVLTMPSLLGPALGPILGGFVVTYFDWRWIFFANLPIAAVGLLLVLRYVPNVKERAVARLDLWGIALTGASLAALIFGFESLGRDTLSAPAVAGLFAGSALCMWLYVRHARGDAAAVLDLSLLRIQTFKASIVGGAFIRLVTGAMPFLLAMLLQVVFGLSPFQAGLLTCMTAAGALVMKSTAPPILRRFGYRRVLCVNAVVCAVFFIALAGFQANTPHMVMMLVLLIGGFFRSLQFTSLNTLAYADVDQARMSRASALSQMGQQLSQSVGVGVSAMLLHLFATRHGVTHLTGEAVSMTFATLGAITVLSLPILLRLPRDAGSALNAPRPT